ncbi:hypothetical protein C1N70_15540 [Cytobacillus firmus]
MKKSLSYFLKSDPGQLRTQRPGFSIFESEPEATSDTAIRFFNDESEPEATSDTAIRFFQ